MDKPNIIIIIAILLVLPVVIFKNNLKARAFASLMSILISAILLIFGLGPMQGVRWIILIALVMISFLLIKKNTIRVLSFLIVVALFVFSMFPLSIEDYFYSFDSVEKAYQYVTGIKADKIDMIIEGEESVLVLSSKDDDNSHNTILIKDNEKYKLGRSINNDTYLCGDVYFDLDLSIKVIKCYSTNDHYVIIQVANDTERTVSDSLSSEYIKVNYASFYPEQKENKASYCAYIANFDENYTVTIDGVNYVPYNFED